MATAPEKPSWPPYPIGPRESIFAMGVAATKFTQLETVLHFVFASAFGLDMDIAELIVSKIGAKPSLELIEYWIEPRAESDAIRDAVSHFISGLNICLENRNLLLHSDLAWTGTVDTILFKHSKKGKLTVAVPTLEELRCVADDMHAYCEFGRALGNHINNSSVSPPVFPAAAFPLPDKPPLPHKLQYTRDSSSPIPLTRPAD